MMASGMSLQEMLRGSGISLVPGGGGMDDESEEDTEEDTDIEGENKVRFEGDGGSSWIASRRKGEKIESKRVQAGTKLTFSLPPLPLAIPLLLPLHLR